MNNAIFLRAPHGAHSLFTACHTGMSTQVIHFFFSPPCIHPSILCAHLLRYFRTIKVDFMLHGAFHHNGETSETRKRLVGGIFNSCHSHCPHLSIPCLLAQLTAPNMVQCWARLHYANAKGETMVRFNGIVLLWKKDAGSRREKQASPILT